MVTECLARYNKCIESNVGLNNDEDAPGTIKDVLGEEDLMSVLCESKNPLYEGAWTTHLVAILLILNCFMVFGVLNA